MWLKYLLVDLMMFYLNFAGKKVFDKLGWEKGETSVSEF